MDYEKKYKEALEKAKEQSSKYCLDKIVLEEIFPELKESEDERMIKFIKTQLFNIKKTITENYELDAKLTKAIDWLEKQCEQKPANWFQELEDKLATATPEQLAEWKEKYFKEEPAEWSEEDDKILDALIRDYTPRNPNYELWGLKMGEIRNWLKSLKDRVQLQPKQEWSEEDEYCRHQLILFCENWMAPDADAKICAHWLKSLKDRYTWKPSDEQMNALHEYIWATEPDKSKGDAVISLFYDLKKLKD